MIDPITEYILEGYLLSDKTISVNLSQFESKKKNKLLIVGVLGSGKTSLGEYLKKKYKVSEFHSDQSGLEKALKSSKRMIIETIEIASLYKEKPEWRQLILNQSMILIGMSAMKAGFRADRRDGTVIKTARKKRDSYISVRDNLSFFQKRLNYLRKDIMKLSDVKIKEYKIPKFKTVLY